MAWQFYDNAGQMKTTDSGTIINSLDDIEDVAVSAAVDGSLLRYEASSTDWEATTATNLLLNDNGQLRVLTNGSSGGITLGTSGDVNLYRSGADTLRTDDTLFAGPSVALGPNASSGISLSGTISRITFSGLDSAVNNAIRLKRSADTFDRLEIGSDGLIAWGGGSAATDVTLGRSAAHIVALGSGDKIQQATMPSAADDLTNQVYVDRMNMFFA